MRLRAAVLTVSDRGSRGLAEDASGPALESLIRARGWEIEDAAMVPDEIPAISAKIASWCDDRRVDLVLTTGGTGLGPRDVTPEATRPLLEKELPGLSERLRREGEKKTILALLSRGLAGSRGTTLIINLPGSPRGAAQSFEAAAELIPHALAMLAGQSHPRQEKTHDHS